jgi:glycosyltransferase involved in cell wall biosynthesis
VTCTEDVVELIKMGCPRSRISVLPEAVDAQEFASVGLSAVKRVARRIVTVARDLLPHKGLDDLVRALPRLPAAELVIVGGPWRDRLGVDRGVCRLRRIATDLGVSDRLHLTGWVPSERLPSILRSADVFAAPSWYEPSGLPVLEAMACGVPVVATDAGGMSDTIIHGVTGILVPARDSGMIAKAIGDVLQVDVLRNGMGSAGRARAVSRYSWERIAVEAESIYQRAAREHRMLSAAKSAHDCKAVS